MERIDQQMAGTAHVIGLAALFCLLWPAGCQKPEPPPLAYQGPTLAGHQLGLAQPPPEGTEYTLLTQTPSTGRFPGALAVARLEPPRNDYASDDSGGVIWKHWWVRTIRYEEAIAWNRLCNQIPQIREVIVLDRYTTVRPNASLAEIAASAARLEAALCLVYGPAPAAEGCAGLWGVILDTITGEKIAVVRAQAGPEDFFPPRIDTNDKDRRHCDVNYLVEVKFQHQVRNCLLELIALDAPPPTTQPSPWRRDATTPTPIYIVPDRTLPRW